MAAAVAGRGRSLEVGADAGRLPGRRLAVGRRRGPVGWTAGCESVQPGRWSKSLERALFFACCSDSNTALVQASIAVSADDLVLAGLDVETLERPVVIFDLAGNNRRRRPASSGFTDPRVNFSKPYR